MFVLSLPDNKIKTYMSIPMQEETPIQRNTAKRTADIYERAIKEAIDRQLSSLSYAKMNGEYESHWRVA
ncbi:MAG: hypothetical protein AAF489_04935 [Bacteroidota bacterium]